MEQINCLNYCDIMQELEQEETIETVVKEAAHKAGFEHVERIYIGSYFCAQYFIHMKDSTVEQVMAYAKHMGIRVTLVIPILPQKDLEEGKKKVEGYVDYFEGNMDEITVNDYGMLSYIHETYDVRLNMGRLFMKDYRDPRYPNFFKTVLRPKIFTRYLTHLIEEYQIDGMEFDRTNIAVNLEKKPKGIVIGMHTPFCYMTVGQICEYASINKQLEKKFRPNQGCGKECQDTIIHYDLQDDREWIRVGRAVYFENQECDIEGIHKYRNIYFPVRLEKFV
ncbi:hypothetical protein [Anaerosporobacter faecicola]|uniref:hypothetical protein n=1 Tax=Anaerosporobacter faecicola TaxID=2718714 RepID=UPI0014391915|nr:hypothetical protein [Anaerosporobacter faecicola]